MYNWQLTSEKIVIETKYKFVHISGVLSQFKVFSDSFLNSRSSLKVAFLEQHIWEEKNNVYIVSVAFIRYSKAINQF